MARSRAQAIDIINQSREVALYEPEWFIEDMLGQTECDPWQINGIQAIADVFRKIEGIPTVINHEGLSRITVRSCHGPGKTHWLGIIMHWWNYCFYGLGVATAPKEKQIKTRLWPRYRSIQMGATPEYKKLIKVTSLKTSVMGNEDWGIVGETASDPENMQGYHAEPQLFLVDEASARNLDPMFPVIEGALTTKGSVLVMIGNPTRSQGEFFDSHMKTSTSRMYYKMHIRPEDSRRVDPEWKKGMAAKYGEQSPVYRVRCLGEFVEMEENQLLSLSWLIDSRRQWEPDGSHRRIRITIDVADGGEDESIVQVNYLYDSFTVFKSIRRFSFAPGDTCVKLSAAVRRIADSVGYDEKNGDDIVVDCIGVGAGMPGNLKEEGFRSIIRHINGSTQNVNTAMYRNQRVRSYIVMRDGFRDGNIIIDEEFCKKEEDWEDYLAQMCSIKTKPGLERVEDLESKQDMKRNGIKSPDMADVSAETFSTISPEVSTGFFDPILTGTMETANASW